MYLNLLGLDGLKVGTFGENSGGTILVGFLAGLGGIGTGLNGPSGCLTGFGGLTGLGGVGSGFGILVSMYQAWLRPLWQFQKITCLLCLLTPPWTSRHF